MRPDVIFINISYVHVMLTQFSGTCNRKFSNDRHKPYPTQQRINLHRHYPSLKSFCKDQRYRSDRYSKYAS